MIKSLLLDIHTNSLGLGDWITLGLFLITSVLIPIGVNYIWSIRRTDGLEREIEYLKEEYKLLSSKIEIHSQFLNDFNVFRETVNLKLDTIVEALKNSKNGKN